MQIITQLGVITLLIPTILSASHYVLVDKTDEKIAKIKVTTKEEEYPFLAWRFQRIINEIENLTDKFSNVSSNNFHITIQEDEFSSNEIEVHSENFKPSEQLQNKLETLVKSYSKDISFYGISLDGKISFGYNPDLKYSAASSIKAPYSLYCYKQIEEGNATFEEILTYSSDYYSTGTGVMKNSNQQKYTIEELLYNTIHYSDNIAYGMLYNHFGTEGYNKMLEELGCRHLQLTPYSEWGFASPREMALVWQEIYQYKETETGKKFFETLLNAKYNFLKEAPLSYDIAHKSGWSSRGYNDHGIVFAETPYIISIMMPYPKTSDKDQSYFQEIAILCNEIMEEYTDYLENKKSVSVKTYK